MHRLMGNVHARAHHVGRRATALARCEGQGTVEYVALILLVALVMAGVVAGMQRFQTSEGSELADVILTKMKEAVRRVAF